MTRPDHSVALHSRGTNFEKKALHLLLRLVMHTHLDGTSLPNCSLLRDLLRRRDVVISGDRQV